MNLFYSAEDGTYEAYYSPLAKAYLLIEEDGTVTAIETPHELPSLASEHFLAEFLGEKHYEGSVRIDLDYDQLYEANGLSSLLKESVYGETTKTHRPVLDIDFPVYVIPSSTEGHCHVILDKYFEHTEYMNLLEDLAEHGIIEQGFAKASSAQGASVVRLPWIKK